MTHSLSPFWPLRHLLWLACAAVVAGCAAGAPAPSANVSGTATYRERIALPPNAVFEATLEDVSRADAPAVVLGRTGIESARVPVEFTIAYDPARIDARHRYVVRAGIRVDGRLMFTTDAAYPVLGIDGVRHVDLLLRRAAADTATATLENTYWKLITLRGQPVEVAPRQREPHLVLHQADRRVAGSGGCNSLAAGYTLDGDRLVFSRGIGTLMACAAGMEQERAFLDTLPAVARWRIEGQRLELLDAGGSVVAQFESRHLR